MEKWKRGIQLLPVILLAACASPPKQPENPTGVSVSPASAWCWQNGGRIDVGDIDLEPWCVLPSGERIDSWTLYRRDHPQK